MRYVRFVLCVVPLIALVLICLVGYALSAPIEAAALLAETAAEALAHWIDD